MNDDSELIITNTKDYLALKQSKLIKILKDISLSNKDENTIRNARAEKVFVDDILGEIPGFKFAKTLLTWSSEVETEINEAKKEILLVNCAEKIESQGKTISSIIDFLSDPSGNTLFSKIQLIMDSNPPDGDLIRHLSNVLKNIIDSDFHSLFNDHKYALAQIELMSPQSLTILADHNNWPQFKSSGGVSVGNIITSPWVSDFVKFYFQSKQTPVNAQKLMKHCLEELVTRQFIQAVNLVSGNSKVELTSVGEMIVRYLNE